ncbi:uncharacterized protein L3040_007847 [Drepanopeziza brunnea f. sp. 'multigermtubi']|nr:hypothetical protein L3040_007847 [Drepanopeziza brunnea f. sp. 'multigermtubi']
MIRVPHSPRTGQKEEWSFTFSWDARTRVTTRLFDSLSDDDMEDIMKYLSEQAHQCHHPILLPAMIQDSILEAHEVATVEGVRSTRDAFDKNGPCTRVTEDFVSEVGNEAV